MKWMDPIRLCFFKTLSLSLFKNATPIVLPILKQTFPSNDPMLKAFNAFPKMSYLVFYSLFVREQVKQSLTWEFESRLASDFLEED